MLAGFYDGVKLDFFAGGQARLILARGLERKHEGERPVGRERFEVTPADQIFVFAGPRGFLILRVADDSSSAEFSDGDVLHSTGWRGDQDDLSFYIFAVVVGFLCSVAD